MDLKALVQKYSVAGPRYTSYPTAPQWSAAVKEDVYRHRLGTRPKGSTLGVYVHLPFCESLCYYCGCNIQITHDKSRSARYVDAVRRELDAVADALPETVPLSQMSWGGGTPTFLSVGEIESLYRAIVARFPTTPDADLSVEVDPRVTTDEQLALMRTLGFNRVSFGVQDFDRKVQETVNRVQPEAMTERMLVHSRQLGYRGINFDLIYGLPYQTEASFERTLDQLVAMRPDRVALFNYARLPDLIPHQKILEKHPMPDADVRIVLFTRAYERLLAAGYVAIGMDHFALADDALALSLKNGTLFRNFQGYVVRRSEELIGLGASAIGEVNGGFFQNTKNPKQYEEAIADRGLATLRGLVLSDDDHRRRWIIQRILCEFAVDFEAYARAHGEDFRQTYAAEIERLSPLVDDGLITVTDKHIRVEPLGRLFVRNAAMAFDAYLDRSPVRYSKTV
jgi:oxygen-independent coproporphyrinogen-3 oxidase